MGADKERVEKETALNELQSFNFDLGDKIYQEDHEAASTEAEREAIQAEVSKVSDWLDEEAGIETPLEDFTSRLKVLRDLAAPIFARVREHRERPEWLENLKPSLNHSTTFLKTSSEKIVNVIEEERLFKEKELEQLEKKIAEVEKWRDEKLAEQGSTPLSEMPKLTVSMINSKIGDLESEVQYLIRKAKKKKAKEAKEGEEEKVSSDDVPPTEAPPAGDGEFIKDPSEEKPESEAEGVEEPVVEEGESVDSKEDAQKSDAEEHVEL